MRLSGRKPVLFTRPWVRPQRVILLGLIALNAVAFILQFILENREPGFTQEFLGVSNRGLHDAYSWQIVTAVLLHHGPWQFAINILALYFLGRDLESIIGQRHFLYLYLTGAAGGEFLHLFTMPAETVLFAASGGVAAVIVANATILPELELSSLTFLGFQIRLKVKHLAYATMMLSIVLVFFIRTGIVTHSGYVGGCAAGWIYAHLLGFGRTSWLQRHLRQKRAVADRFRHLSPDQLIAEEIDPLLEKIWRSGFGSLTRAERSRLARARERMLEQK